MPTGHHALTGILSQSIMKTVNSLYKSASLCASTHIRRIKIDKVTLRRANLTIFLTLCRILHRGGATY